MGARAMQRRGIPSGAREWKTCRLVETPIIIMGEECNSPRAEQPLLLSTLTMETTVLHLNYAFVFGPVHQCSPIQAEVFKYSEVRYLTHLPLHNLWEWEGSLLILISANSIPTDPSDPLLWLLSSIMGSFCRERNNGGTIVLFSHGPCVLFFQCLHFLI